ncbi:DUF3379 domain-containing protein [Paraglaciecola sp. 2405UD69-4]|uniref:DUF3379 domain-containing protein n=1 Tax=Paraglaciecola sp. 2405UD69-4 TaxID=3391836 RepID=UPI0039C9FBCA
MDDLEFRRTLYSDPNCQDKKLKEAMLADPKKQEFCKELKLLDKKMQQAFEVDVPADLVHKLLLKQTMESHAQSKKRNVFQFAMVASVAFVMGISFTLWQSSTLINLSENAIAHVRAEGDHALGANENVSLEQVNAKLASFGGQLTDNVDRIYYANFCDFDEVRSLHMVMQIGDEKVTVFVVPNESNFDSQSVSKDKHYSGEAMDFSKASVIVVGDNGANVSKAKQSLSKKFKFSA